MTIGMGIMLTFILLSLPEIYVEIKENHKKHYKTIKEAFFDENKK